MLLLQYSEFFLFLMSKRKKQTNMSFLNKEPIGDTTIVLLGKERKTTILLNF